MRFNKDMYRRPSESFLEYKKRVIDSKSNSFCGAKWYNATIWLGSGKTTSCHHPPAHDISLSEINNNHKALHNTEHKKLMRKMMQNGEKPVECEYCWKMESVSSSNISDRVFKTEIYSDLALNEAYQLDWKSDVNLKTLEIAFDRQCNFACSYCNPSFSSKWASDIIKNGPYKNLITEGASHFVTAADDAEPFKNTEKNPYIEAFWKWWPELSSTLQEIRITGGEPLINKNTWKFFDFFEQNSNKKLVFAINTNLGAEKLFIDKLIDKSRHVNNLRIFTSCEATYEQAEYIRDGLNYRLWKDNVHRIMSEAQLESCNIMMTINALCLFSMIQFLDELSETKSKFPKGKIHISVNVLRFPSFQSVLTLPQSIRNQKSDELKQWLDVHKETPFWTDFEIESLKRLAEYLTSSDNSPHHGSSSIKNREKDFKTFYTQYDQRRGKNFNRVFPELLTAWYTSI